MNGSKFVPGALVAAVVAFLLSGLWHVVLMSDYYESAAVGGREAPLMWVIGLAYLMVGIIMAYMYPKGYEGGSPVGEGLKFGAIIGLLWWFPTNLVLYAVLDGPSSAIFVDGAWHIVEEGIAGAALGWVYGRSLGGDSAALPEVPPQPNPMDGS